MLEKRPQIMIFLKKQVPTPLDWILGTPLNRDVLKWNDGTFCLFCKWQSSTSGLMLLILWIRFVTNYSLAECRKSIEISLDSWAIICKTANHLLYDIFSFTFLDFAIDSMHACYGHFNCGVLRKQEEDKQRFKI